MDFSIAIVLKSRADLSFLPGSGASQEEFPTIVKAILNQPANRSWKFTVNKGQKCLRSCASRVSKLVWLDQLRLKSE